ncbi:hypothetical protein B0F90DRAFT_1665253 [Multifurca ochricompacta]|uniref:DRBM domain-containing protein n=1 Tax=Multifurca ochricompacta TaxID=376703 RepID=A0AAD4QS74_9AGAM|nr:hypothetical protein B0F90DRAFT_1665253 [Multifurca ochricompacta]
MEAGEDARSVLFVFSLMTYADKTDYVVALNNFLQEHPAGNLSPFFRWLMTQEGPNHQVVHIATAVFRGVAVGEGRGTSKGRAKNAAAKDVLANFQENGVPGS